MSFLSSYLHLSLQTVKYLFPIEDFYLLLKYVFMSGNINWNTSINTTLKQCSVMPLFSFLAYLQCLQLVSWSSMKRLEKASDVFIIEIINNLINWLFGLSAVSFLHRREYFCLRCCCLAMKLYHFFICLKGYVHVDSYMTCCTSYAFIVNVLNCPACFAISCSV